MQIKSLFQYSRDGNLDEIKEIFAGNLYRALAQINTLDENKVSALHYAARYSNMEVMHYLVEQGAHVDVLGDDNLTPLHYAARFKLSQVQKTTMLVSTYLTDNSINQSITDKSIKRVLGIDRDEIYNENKVKEDFSPSKNNVRAKTVDDPVVRYLVQQGADINKRDKYGLTPLHYACMRGNLEATKELLRCPDLDLEAVDEQKLTPMHLACTYGQTDCVKELIEAGSNLISRDERGLSPLHKACAIERPKLVKMIIKNIEDRFDEAGVTDILSHVDVDNNTPLLLAVECGCLETVEVLISYDASVNESNEDTMFPLHLACTVGSLEIAKVLIRSGADIHSRNLKYQTPLHLASLHNNPSIIEHLISSGADVDSRDDNNFTPILLAARRGNTESLKILLHNNGQVQLVDKEDRSCLYLAAEQDHSDCIDVLLQFESAKQLIEVCDRWDNTPLHIACINGFYDIAKILINAGADISAKNEDEQTPLHSAAKNGKARIVKKILKINRFAVNDEDFQSNTALHLACIEGHYSVVAALIEADADIMSRNYVLWTPLDCAAANGWQKCVQLLIKARAPVDPIDKKKFTPLHHAAKFGHEEVAQLLMQHGASTQKRDFTGKNALDIAIVNGNRNIVSCILESKHWRSAFQNEFYTSSGIRETPLRLLIKKYPDLAKVVFDKCIDSNLHNPKISHNTKSVSADDYNLMVTMNFEFLDDTYTVDGIDLEEMSDNEVWDENGKLSAFAVPYTTSSNQIKQNHPLQIMVNNKRTELLGHPLCKALVRRKWNSFARYVFYFNVVFYLLFLLSLTSYMQSSPRPYKMSELLLHSLSPNMTIADSISKADLANNRNCIFLEQNLHIKKDEGIHITQLLIIIQAIVWIVKEFLQFLQNLMVDEDEGLLKSTYFGWDNGMDLFCYISGLLIVYDFDDCQETTGLRNNWQWQLGAITVTVSWLNFLSLLRKLPFVGIYVVMFTDVFRTFLKVSVIILLFVIAFSFGFYALLAEQEPFSTAWYSIMKTTVMTVGEFEFDSIFFENGIYGGSTSVPYEFTTFVFFAAFMVVMPIIITNLLVGLAVDDIKSVQENAVLKRLAMQVELNLSVENLLPECIKRRFAVKSESFLPNRPGNLISKILFDETAINEITKSFLNEELDTAMNSLHTKQEQIGHRVDTIKASVRQMQEELSTIRHMLVHIGKQNGKEEFMLEH